MEIVNQKVIHKTLGEGLITWFGGKSQNNNKYIRVEFAEKSIELQYPIAFKNFLNAVDPEFENMIDLELKKIDEEEQAKKEKAVSVLATKKSKPINISLYQQIKLAPHGNNTILRIGNAFGTNSRRAYLKCCQLFGWDQSAANNFGRQGAQLYAKNATPEGFSPWFISNHNLEQTKGGKWNNTIDGNYIYEEWDETDDRLWADKTTRVVFLKLKGTYHFFGVYCTENIELKANGKYTKTYKRVSKEYPN